MTVRHSSLRVADGFGGLVRARRTALGLSVRETGRRIGISASYLVALEQGRNPTTGRPPVPSPTVLAAIGRVLEVELSVLLDLTVTPRSESVHLLLYQSGAGRRSPLAAARQVFADEVDAWIEIADPRRAVDEDDHPDDRLVQRHGPLGASRPGAERFESADVLAALGDLVREAPFDPQQRLGVVFGGNSLLLRTVENPEELLESETTWERDAASQCRADLAIELFANVCVYREADIQELAPRLDPLATVLRLIKAHPHVASQDDQGVVTTGPAAIETILTAARPPGTNTATWATLARAAAIGLMQDAGAARAVQA
jgi:transcriptional regulator with XRE-family HTH domain